MLATCLKAPPATPLGTNFLCVADVAPNRTESGLELPEAARESVLTNTKAFTVVRVGPGLGLDCGIGVGSRVLFAYPPTSHVTIEGVKYHVAEPDSVAVILDEPMVEVE